MKNWVIAGVVVAGLFAVLFLSDRPVQTPSGVDLIRSPSQYAAANNKAQALALAVFQKADAGGMLTDTDKANLREAIKQFEAMSIYEPRHIASYFGSGKSYMLLGEKEKAGERFAQAVFNKETDPQKDEDVVKLTVIEAMALLSEVTLDLAVEELGNANSADQANDKKGADEARKRSKLYYDQALKYADMAVKAKPEGVRYLIDRSRVYLALNKRTEAKADFEAAKKLAPSDPLVTQTAKLFAP